MNAALLLAAGLALLVGGGDLLVRGASRAARDIWVLLAGTGLLLLLLRTGWRIGRLEGAVLLAGYAAYLAAITLGG